jgi:hypothetical protein
MGDITIEVFPEQCVRAGRGTGGRRGLIGVWDRTPKTVENFVTHCRNGYYDGLLFHRVIRNFMLQTGDPLGTPFVSVSVCLSV